MSAPSRSWPAFLLRLLLRYIGGVSLLALVPVFMPYAWMDGIHRALGMGRLPSEPVVGYLARSLSLFYALTGGLLLLCSFDLHRYRNLICYLGAAFLFFGLTIWGVDFAEGMPLYWKSVEGPFVAAYGAAVVTLTLRLKPLKGGNPR